MHLLLNRDITVKSISRFGDSLDKIQSQRSVVVIFVRETRGRSIEGFIVVRNAAQGGTQERKRTRRRLMRGR